MPIIRAIRNSLNAALLAVLSSPAVNAKDQLLLGALDRASQRPADLLMARMARLYDEATGTTPYGRREASIKRQIASLKRNTRTRHPRLAERTRLNKQLRRGTCNLLPVGTSTKPRQWREATA